MNEIATSKLDEPLSTIMAQLRTTLEKGGVVQRRPNGNFRLRWREYDAERGYVVQRSMSLGPNLADAQAVSETIKKWRHEARAAKAEAEREEAERLTTEKIEAAESRLQHHMIAMGIGGGRDQQRRTVRELRAALDLGSVEALRFVLGLEERRPTKPGRPRRGRIW